MSATSAVTMAKHDLAWSVVLSILMIVAGILAILSPIAGGLAVTMIVGCLFIFSGAAHFVYGWHARSAGWLVWEWLLGVLYIFVGGYLLSHVAVGLAALTVVLGVFLVLEAILEFVLSFQLRPLPGSGWLLFDGILTLMLAILIFKAWPSSTNWALGIILGVSMLFSGVARLVLSIEARHDLGKVAA